MAPSVLLETDVLIDHLRQTSASSPKETLFERTLHAVQKVYLTTVSIQELYVGQSTKKAAIEGALQEFLLQFTLVPLSMDITRQAGILMRDYPPLTFPDASIAATAVMHQLPFLTINRKDFRRIPQLKFFSQT